MFHLTPCSLPALSYKDSTFSPCFYPSVARITAPVGFSSIFTNTLLLPFLMNSNWAASQNSCLTFFPPQSCGCLALFVFSCLVVLRSLSPDRLFFTICRWPAYLYCILGASCLSSKVMTLFKSVSELTVVCWLFLVHDERCALTFGPHCGSYQFVLFLRTWSLSWFCVTWPSHSLPFGCFHPLVFLVAVDFFLWGLTLPCH